jgi:hypothetical protein
MLKGNARGFFLKVTISCFVFLLIGSALTLHFGVSASKMAQEYRLQTYSIILTRITNHLMTE